MRFPFSKKTKEFLESKEKRSILTSALIAFKLQEAQGEASNHPTLPGVKGKDSLSEDKEHRLLFEAI